MDKTNPQCMYNIGQVRSWSLPHLKTGCWYIDCGKGFCPEGELELKASIDAKDTTSGSHPAAEEAGKGAEDDADIVVLSDKDKKKEDARIAREKKKKEKEEERSKGKGKLPDSKGKGKGKGKAGKKKEESSRKSKDDVETLSEDSGSSSDDSPGTQAGAMSTGSLKRDAAFAGLSISRMQPDIAGKLKDCVGASINVDEFFFKGSFLSVESHYAEHNTFPKEWLELKAFLEKVS